MIPIIFDAQFADDVEWCIKTQTVRKVAPCKKGDRLELFTNPLQGPVRKLVDATCTAVKPIRIDAMGITLDGNRLFAGSAYRDETDDRDNDFAKKDGFGDFMEMADWFADRYGLPFDGVVIYWRPQP